MSHLDLVYPQFPQAPHWVRWIDHVAAGPTRGSRVLHVVLSPYLPGRDATMHRMAKEPPVVKVISVGNLPDFGVGDIFCDRRLRRSPSDSGKVASVCHLRHPTTSLNVNQDGLLTPVERSTRERELVDEVGATEFQFRLRDKPPRSVKLSDEDADKRPDWHREKHPNAKFMVLSNWMYPALLSRNSRCLYLEDVRGRVVLVPAAELIRTFMLPASGLANAFFGWPAAAALSRFVLPPLTTDDPAVFTLNLKANTPPTYALFLAGMSEGFNPSGARAANEITVAQLQHVRPFSPQASQMLAAESDGLRPAAACLPATLPFEVDTLTLRVTCFEFMPGRFLVAKIAGGTWPDPRPFAVSTPTRPPQVRGGANDPPPIPKGEGAGQGGNMHVDGGADPGIPPVALATEGQEWVGFGTVTQIRRPPNPGEPGIRKFLGAQTGEDLGTGTDMRKAGRHLADMRRRYSSAGLGRIGDVIYALDALEDQGELSYEIKPAPEEDQRRRAWDVNLWDIPNWRMRNADGAKPKVRLRTVMVAKVHLHLLSAYWLEIEDSGLLEYCSILLRLAPSQSNSMLVEAIGTLGADHTGRQIAFRFASKPGCRVLLCKHRYVADDGREESKRLDQRYVLDKLLEVAGG